MESCSPEWTDLHDKNEQWLQNILEEAYSNTGGSIGKDRSVNEILGEN